MVGFVHTHVHTEYSLLDGESKIPDVIDRVIANGQPAVSINDHGTAAGTLKFYNEALKKGVHPIIGTEAYLAKRTRFDREQIDRRPYHLLFHAMNNTGYDNMKKLLSIANNEGYYYRPRVDRELLEEYNEGLIATSSCLAGEIPQAILAGNYDLAYERAKWWRDIFGDRFYLELQYRESKNSEQHIVNKWLMDQRGLEKIHNDKPNPFYGMKYIVTSDSHYTERKSSDLHDTLLCIQTKATKSQEKRMRFDEDTYYLVETELLEKTYRDTPDVLLNTLEIAERCNVDLSNKGYHLPTYDVPDGYTHKSYLKELVDIGLQWRYGSDADTHDVQQRALFELDVIDTMGFNTYFLVVWDIVEYARHTDIWFNVRGSGAGSIVAYALGITSLEPLRNNLIFERFLNPGRVTMPDIDLDFDDERRPQIFSYIKARYGVEKIAGIRAFGTMKAKSAFRDVGRTYEVPLEKVNKALSFLPAIVKNEPIEEFYNTIPEFASVVRTDDELKRVYDTVKLIEKRIRHGSAHPAGIIVADAPIINYVPLTRASAKQLEMDIPQLTEFEMDECEGLGLLKIDVLGLRTIRAFRRACEFIKERHNVDWNLDTIPYYHTGDADNDNIVDEALALLGRGETVGVFQVEGAGLTGVLKKMQPRSYENIIDAISLYRPGPMQFIDNYIDRLHDKETVEYRHPALEPILKVTQGIIIYQEQIMQICSDLFGYTQSEADLMRRAVSKKKPKEMVYHRKKVMEQGPKNGIPVSVCEQIFDDIEYFINYGFNKAHGADYAKLTMQTAAIKALYPIEFLTALLESVVGTSDKVAVTLLDTKNYDIDILPPDINKSDVNFTIENVNGKDAIRCGLSVVKNAGASPALELISGRPYYTLRDVVENCNFGSINKTAIENLIRVGAFDKFGKRHDLLSALKQLKAYSKRHIKQVNKSMEQQTLFDMNDLEVPDLLLENFIGHERVDEFTDRELLDFEKELIGFYITGRPIDKYRETFRDMGAMAIDDFLLPDDENEYINRKVRCGGEIIGIKRIVTKNGNDMAFLTLQDWHDTASEISIIVFPKMWKQYALDLSEGSMLVVIGKLEYGRGRHSIIADEFRFVEDKE